MTKCNFQVLFHLHLIITVELVYNCEALDLSSYWITFVCTWCTQVKFKVLWIY